MILKEYVNPKQVDVKQGLRYMREHRSVGILAKKDKEDNTEYAHLEVTWDPSNETFAKRAFVRDKVTMAIVRLNRHVEFWRY